jgi:hypothetical protein
MLKISEVPGSDARHPLTYLHNKDYPLLDLRCVDEQYLHERIKVLPVLCGMLDKGDISNQALNENQSTDPPPDPPDAAVWCDECVAAWRDFFSKYLTTSQK